MEREIVQFPDKETISEFWNDLYWENSSVVYEGYKYTHVEKIHRHNCDGECADWILQREHDGKYFKLKWWEGGSDGYEFNNGDNSIEEIFPKQTITVEYV